MEPEPSGLPGPEPRRTRPKHRKRAVTACLSCRARKVRCDVSQRGRPCMNCFLDQEACIVKGRAVRRTGLRTSENNKPIPSPVDQNEHRCQNLEARAPESIQVPEENAILTPNNHQTIPESQTDLERVEKDLELDQLEISSFDPFLHDSTLSNNFDPTPCLLGGRRGGAVTVTYSYYPFLTLSNLPNIPPQDVNFLELQGCLQLPARPILDDFIQQYFLHVHPLLPLFNEGDFWDMYFNKGAGPFSLLNLQAMLFSSCNFVSKESTRSLGFSSSRDARAYFYRLAKLLFDMEAESSSLALAQSALLLSYWAPPASLGLRKPNSAWLTTAIHHARTMGVDRYSSLPLGTSTAQAKRQNVFKRLWWCCVIRDRIVGLSMRRPLQLTQIHSEVDVQSMLGFADLRDEMDRSRVYNPEAKRSLAGILEHIIGLCVVLTDILMFIFPQDNRAPWERRRGQRELDQVRECKLSLEKWYQGAVSRFPMFRGDARAKVDHARVEQFQHDSVILYTNLLYMYYYSSRVIINHHEILHFATNTTTGRDFNTISEIRSQLQDATSGVAECLTELIDLRLTRWLPLSAAACTALPLVLHILDAQLWSLSNDHSPLDMNETSGVKQRRLNILIEAMKVYQPQYDSIDWVTQIIRHIVELAQIPRSQSPNKIVTLEWTDILSLQPSSYLRLALTLDLSLSKSRLPEDSDFPEVLRGLFTRGYNPLRPLLEGRHIIAMTQKSSSRASADVTELSAELLAVERDTITTQFEDPLANEGQRQAKRNGAREEDQLRDKDLCTSRERSGDVDLGDDVAPDFWMDDNLLSAGIMFDDRRLDAFSSTPVMEWSDVTFDEQGVVRESTEKDSLLLLEQLLTDSEVAS